MLTDNTGIIQHLKGSIADYSTGYCTDDNTRTFILSIKAYHRFKDTKYLELIYKYLSFVMHMQNEDGAFKNFLSYNRDFEEEQNLDDAFGRAVWSLGYIIRFALNYFEVAEKTRNFLEKHCFVNNYVNRNHNLFNLLSAYTRL
jgi:hypothetical protein